MSNIKIIELALNDLKLFFNGNVPDGRIQLFAEKLNKYDIQDVLDALNKCSETCDFYPSLKQILDKINGPTIDTKTLGVDLAGEIINCIRQFGRYQVKEVYKHLGEEGARVIERCGGWDAICNTNENQLDTLRSQLRDACMSAIVLHHPKFKGHGISNKRIAGNVLDRPLEALESPENASDY